MKVPVTVVIDVDVDEYRRDYGTNDTAAEIREDMRDRAVDAVNWELRFHTQTWFRGADLRK